MTIYEEKALRFAEKYGIIEYDVIDKEMKYVEIFGQGDNKEIYESTVNLETMSEQRRRRVNWSNNAIMK